ncbi:MAG: DUF92 domain-containing protein [Candidatus Thermoplasmatota archaeon]
MVDILTPAKLLQVLAVGLVGVYTYKKDMLNATGAFTAFVMGALIVLFTNLLWLFLLFALLGLGSAATRFRFREKQVKKVSEKQGGRRSTRNVVANGATPVVFAVLAPLVASTFGPNVAGVAYVSAIAVAAADTFASEFGSLAARVRLITTFKVVPAGVDGGVSWQGQAAALAGGLLISLLGALFLGIAPLWIHTDAPIMRVTWLTVLLPTLMGFVGCQVDSVIGATLEDGGLFTKEETNLLAISVGAVLGLVLALALHV